MDWPFYIPRVSNQGPGRQRLATYNFGRQRLATHNVGRLFAGGQRVRNSLQFLVGACRREPLRSRWTLIAKQVRPSTASLTQDAVLASKFTHQRDEPRWGRFNCRCFLPTSCGVPPFLLVVPR